MPVDSETRQRLLELIYELLPEAEAKELRERIRREPELARAYSEAQQRAGWFAEAARRTAPAIDLRCVDASRPTVAEPAPKRPAARSRPATAARARGAQWAVSIAAAVLLLISVGGFLRHRERLAAVAGEHLRLMVAGPSQLQEGVPGNYEIRTATVTGKPIPARITLAVYSPSGDLLMKQEDRADDDGRFLATVPAEQVAHGMQLEVSASYRESREEVRAAVGAASAGALTHVALDRSAYAPGDRVYYRSLTVSRLGLEEVAGARVHFNVFDPQGNVVPGAENFGLTERGVGNGAVDLPRDAGGVFRLTAASPQDTFAPQSRTIVIAGSSPNEPADTAPDPPPLENRFYPEGGDLVAGLENRVYFSARGPSGEPVELEGVVLDGQGNEVARAQTASRGRGAVRFVPQAGEEYRFRPAAVPDGPETAAELTAPLPPVTAGHGIVLSTPQGVFGAQEPLRCTIQSLKAGIPLVAVASCRGVTVGQAVVVTDTEPTVAQIDLPADAGGVLRLTLYRYDRSVPEPVAERLVYRRLARRLLVRIEGTEPVRRAGESAELSIAVADESSAPVPQAALGVAVTDDALADDAPSPLADFLIAAELAEAEALEAADLALPDDPKAAEAFDLLLGTQGWRRFDAKSLEELRREGGEESLARVVGVADGGPPLVLDNLPELREKYAHSLDAYRNARTRGMNLLTTLSFFGGLGLVILVAMLALLRIAGGIQLWAPAVVAAVGCLVLGAILMDPGRLSRGPSAAVAFHSYRPEPRAVRSVAAVPAERAKDATIAARGRRLGPERHMPSESAEKRGSVDKASASQADFHPAEAPLAQEEAVEQALPDRMADHVQLNIPAQTVPLTEPARSKIGPHELKSSAKAGEAPLPAPAETPAAEAPLPMFAPQAPADEVAEKDESAAVPMETMPFDAPAALADGAESARRQRAAGSIAGQLAEPSAAAASSAPSPAASEEPAPAPGMGGMGGGGFAMDEGMTLEQRASEAGEAAPAGSSSPVAPKAQELVAEPQAPAMEDAEGQPSPSFGAEPAARPARDRSQRRLREKRDDSVAVDSPTDIVRKLLGDRITFPVREYAYRDRQVGPSPGGPPKTLFWNPLVTTGADGRARVRFDLPDREATYRVQVTAHGSGRLGTGTAEIHVKAGEVLYRAAPLTAAGLFTEGIEGPACDRAGNVYAVNFQRQGTIGRVTPDGEAELFVALPEGSTGNALRIDRQGRMFVADYTGHRVLQIDLATRQIGTFAAEPRFHQPNDLALSRDGTLFASDPDWTAGTGQIWRISPQGKPALAAGPLGTTNGVALSPDGRTLYVSESNERKVWAFPVNDDGALGQRRLVRAFPDHGLDGLRVDVAGDLYVTRYGKGTVVQLSPQGKLLREIDVLGARPSNLAFGGPDGRTAYVTEVEHRRIVQFRVERPGLDWQRLVE